MAQNKLVYPIESKKWMSRAEAAAYLGICLPSFDRMIRPWIPEIIAAGDPRYDRADIDGFMTRNKMDAETIMNRRRAA